MNYKNFTLGDWICYISGVIEDESELDGNEMRDLVEFLSGLPRWIPVSERLPEKSGHYWCTFDGTYLIGIDFYSTEEDARRDFGEFEEYIGWSSDNVVAWMPLPKPYKAESEDEE